MVLIFFNVKVIFFSNNFSWACLFLDFEAQSVVWFSAYISILYSPISLSTTAKDLKLCWIISLVILITSMCSLKNKKIVN